MRVQYQLVDVETRKAIPVGEVFELVDCMKTYFGKGEPMSWLENIILCGDPLSIKNPVGILGTSPVEAARKAIL